MLHNSLVDNIFFSYFAEHFLLILCGILQNSMKLVFLQNFKRNSSKNLTI